MTSQAADCKIYCPRGRPGRREQGAGPSQWLHPTFRTNRHLKFPSPPSLRSLRKLLIMLFFSHLPSRGSAESTGLSYFIPAPFSNGLQLSLISCTLILLCFYAAIGVTVKQLERPQARGMGPSCFVRSTKRPPQIETN